MQNGRRFMDQYSILSNEIKSWERFEYALREENRLLFNKWYLNARKMKITCALLTLKMNTFQLNHCLWC